MAPTAMCATEAAIKALPESSDTMIYENLAAPTDLYFLPEDILRLQSLLQTIESIFPEGMFPTLAVSNLVVLDIGAGPVECWVPYFRVLVKREYRLRPFEKGKSHDP